MNHQNRFLLFLLGISFVTPALAAEGDFSLIAYVLGLFIFGSAITIGYQLSASIVGKVMSWAGKLGALGKLGASATLGKAADFAGQKKANMEGKRSAIEGQRQNLSGRAERIKQILGKPIGSAARREKLTGELSSVEGELSRLKSQDTKLKWGGGLASVTGKGAGGIASALFAPEAIKTILSRTGEKNKQSAMERSLKSFGWLGGNEVIDENRRKQMAAFAEEQKDKNVEEVWREAQHRGTEEKVYAAQKMTESSDGIRSLEEKAAETLEKNADLRKLLGVSADELKAIQGELKDSPDKLAAAIAATLGGNKVVSRNTDGNLVINDQLIGRLLRNLEGQYASKGKWNFVGRSKIDENNQFVLTNNVKHGEESFKMLINNPTTIAQAFQDPSNFFTSNGELTELAKQLMQNGGINAETLQQVSWFHTDLKDKMITLLDDPTKRNEMIDEIAKSKGISPAKAAEIVGWLEEGVKKGPQAMKNAITPFVMPTTAGTGGGTGPKKSPFGSRGTPLTGSGPTTGPTPGPTPPPPPSPSLPKPPPGGWKPKP